MTKLVYIGGYGHSGSALLEYLLAASPQIVACGEIARVPGERNRNGKCSCGRSARDCLLWGPLLGSPRAVFAQSHDRLLLALLERVKGRYAAVVDSSKTDWRSMAAPFRFRTAMGSDFLLVHLVRHPCGVAWSAVTEAKRQDKRPLSLLRPGAAALGWSIGNLTCELFRRRHGRAYRRLRYEDLANAPETVMRDLLAALLPEAEWRAADIGISRENRHQLCGAGLCGTTMTLADIKEDEDWKRDMPKLHRALVRAITFPLRKRYGYE